MHSNHNIYQALHEAAQRLPEKPAIIQSNSAQTFAQLIADIDQCCHRLTAAGLRPAMRTILMVPPGREFFVITYALFKLGAIPILIDPGMPRAALVQCLAEVEATAFISIPKGLLFHRIYRKQLPAIRILINAVGRVPFAKFFGIHNLPTMSENSAQYQCHHTGADDLAAILFTSGSTGIPKGTVYTHSNFNAQIRSLEKSFGYSETEIDVPTFPLFALFDVALGMTAVIPQMDFTKPAAVNPLTIRDCVRNHGATHLFGSPALLDRVSSYFIDTTPPQFATLKRIVTAGAPVRPDILQRLTAILPADAEIYTAYGATESLPVALATASMILTETADKYYNGHGTCVGYPVEDIEVKIIKITDAPIATMSEIGECTPGNIGEILVNGDVVTQSYFARPTETAASKITDPALNKSRHRMGDLGYLDEHGRLWFCGRKSQRVRTANGDIYTELAEGIFNANEHVFRSALVGVGKPDFEEPVIYIQRTAGRTLLDTDLRTTLLQRAAQFEITAPIKTLLFHDKFPVDIRHNAKIFREKLKQQATQTLGIRQ